MERFFALKSFVLLALAVLIAAGCSSDADTPLGMEFIDDGIIGTRPGEVFQDTIQVTSGDQSFTIGSKLDKNSTLVLGAKNGYRSTMVIKIDFSGAGSDTNRVVEKARLRIRSTSTSPEDTLTARFFGLLTEYNEGDTLQSLDLDPSPIPDTTMVNVDRTLPTALGLYTLPAGLVQDWIRGNQPHNGIAVVIDGAVSGKQATFGSREFSDNTYRPLLTVDFEGGVSRSYSPSDDGTYVESTASTSNLILSDGFIRRILIPVDLSRFSSDVITHDARLLLHVVPSSQLGSDFGIFLYAPKSDDPLDPDSRYGQGISRDYVDFTTGEVSLPVRNVLLLFLGGSLENNGFAIQFDGEGSSLRQVEFYTSDSDSLGPRIILTASEAPSFDR